jgi:uncharacterized protein (DUF2267 family)
MRVATFYRRVAEASGLDSRDTVKRGTAAVLRALRDRLTPEEARHVAAQLPGDIKRIWEAGADWGPRPVRMHRREMYERVKADAVLRSAAEARTVTVAVFAALQAQVSPGEADDIWAQLPRDLKEVWEEAGERAREGAGTA